MTKLLGDLQPVYVVGAGWHRYQRLSETSYVDLRLTAVRGALDDAGISWADVDESFIGTGLLGMAVGRPMLRHLALGKPLVTWRTPRRRDLRRSAPHVAPAGGEGSALC